MKKKLLYLLIFSITNISLLFGQRFIIADDIYYQKGDELINENIIEEESDTIHNILILEPEIRNYEEGIIIYKNDNGTNDTIYIFDDPEIYLNQSAQ